MKRKAPYDKMRKTENSEPVQERMKELYEMTNFEFIFTPSGERVVNLEEQYNKTETIKIKGSTKLTNK